MKKFFLILLIIAVAAFAVWKFILKKGKKTSEPAPVGMAVSKHSDDFNQSVIKMMDAYYGLTESFVNWDMAAINTDAAGLKSAIDSLKLQEMKKDSIIYPTAESQWHIVKTEVDGLITDETLEEKKEALNMLSQQIFDLLRVMKFDAAKVYYQECPMALNNYKTSGFWLSREGEDETRRNPYLGLYDPKYSKAMLTCGSTRDSIRTN
jgi:uncharacterized protein YlaN (UPF0358 family)